MDLSSSQSLTINNGTGDDLTVNGTLNLSGGLDNGGYGLTGTGKTVINGTCNWNSGHITSTDFNIASGGVMNMEGSGECRINWDGVVNNAGTVNFAKTDVSFVMYYNGTFNNLDGGIFEATTNQSIYYRQDLSQYNVPVFNNAGTFKKTTGTGTTAINRVKFNNTGTVLIESGIFQMYNYVVGTHSGTFTVASGAKILSSNYCTHTFQEGSVINGEGEYETTSGDNNEVTGTTNGLIIDTDVTFKLSGTSVMTGAGKLTINGTFEWTSTGGFNTKTIINSVGANLNISGESQKTHSWAYADNILRNYGTITWTGTGKVSGGGRTIRNESTGVFDIQNNVSLEGTIGPGRYTVINDGIIKKTAGSGTSTFWYTNFTNNGTLRVDTGTFRLDGGADITNFNSDQKRLNGGTYNLIGTFQFETPSNTGIVSNNATIILDGASSEMLLDNSNNALASLENNLLPESGNEGILILRNGRNFSTDAATFTNWGTLDCGTNIFSGSGNFTNSGGTLIIGSPDGITSSGSSGNIQSNGTRSFLSTGKYTYNGSSAQVTGNGLPSEVNSLTIANSSGVTLSSNVTASTNLTLSDGALSTGSNTLTLGTSAESVGTLTYTNGKIIGNFKRWIAAETANDILFPIGTTNNYRPANISFTSAPSTGGTLTAVFTTGNPGTNGLPLNDGGANIQNIGQDGCWTFTSGDGLDGGTYNIDITAEGFGGIIDYTKLHLLKRNNSESSWTNSGTHNQCTGSNDSPILHRNGLNSFSEFGVGSTSDNPLPVELISFIAFVENQNVILNWETATEINNYGFEVERNANLQGFEKIGFIPGYGTSNSLKSYEFIDSIPPIGNLKYQLKQIDSDGTYYYYDTIVDITFSVTDVHEQQLPDNYDLYQNYPNPFNPFTIISFAVPKADEVSIRVYDIIGREVAVLLNENKKPGYYEVMWNAGSLASGIYYIAMSTSSFRKVNKSVLMK